MTSNRKITALIAVKANSDRVKNKNIRPFADSNLLEIKLAQIQPLDIFDEVIVSSESDVVLSMCEPYNVTTHKRDSFYSTSEVPMSDVYEYLAKFVRTEYIAWIPVTNPLVDGQIYKDAVTAFKSMDHKVHDSLLSVNIVQEYLYYNDKRLNFTLEPWQRSQDLVGTCAINFAINILSKENMIDLRSTVGKNPYFFNIDKSVAIDIDYNEDFILAEILYKLKRGIYDS
jgi:CMP-N-acetylneuraminic acid synthetase